MGTKETLLVRVDDCHQRHLRQVEPFTEEVDTDKHVVNPGAQVVENLYAVECVDIRMDVGGLYFQFEEIVVQLFGHTFGEGGHQYAFATFAALLYLLEQMVDLV